MAKPNQAQNQAWGVTKSKIFDSSCEEMAKTFSNILEKLNGFISVKLPNPPATMFGKHDRPMTGQLAGLWHCHLRDDAVLIYRLKNRCIHLICVVKHAEIEGKRLRTFATRLKNADELPENATISLSERIIHDVLSEILLENEHFTLPVTDENIRAAKKFVFEKWKERAREMGRDEPIDLSSACKFASLFAAKVFGGTVRGNFFHQWVELPSGQHLDLNSEAADVATMLQGEIPNDTKSYAQLNRKKLPNPLYTHDDRHMKTRGNKESMDSIRPRVDRWVEEFLKLSS